MTNLDALAAAILACVVLSLVLGALWMMLETRLGSIVALVAASLAVCWAIMRLVLSFK